MIIGCHVGFGNNQLLGSVKEAISYGANAFMFYTGAPQNTLRKEINEEETNLAWQMMKENKIDINNVICHAPYIINLANNIDEKKWDFSINFLKQELLRCDKLGIKYMVLHPGSAVSLEREEAINNIIKALNIILESDSNCQILLETMAGKGTEIGVNMEELKRIIFNVRGSIGVCLDTCHLNDSGIDIALFDEYLEEFEKQIGIDKVKCLHINDSKNLRGTHKDRHENIGYGTIGFDNLLNVCLNPKLKDVPKILETPYVGEDKFDSKRLYPPYKFEIEMLKMKKFDEELIEKIIAYYK